MAVQYETYQDLRKGSNRLFYGRAVHPQTIGLEALAERVQRQCSMTKGDCLAVLTELVTVMNDELQNSNKVKIDGLGTFYIAIKSSGSIVEDEYNVNNHVKAIKVNFLAEGKKTNGKLTRTFTNGVKFVKAQNKVK